MSDTNLLEATDLAKSYRKREVVKSVSMHVRGGEIVGLLGPNGAGKTTCFYMIVGLIDNDSGVIRLNDKTISHLPMHRRAKLGIGYLPQEASVFRNLTVQQNILAILQLRKDLDSSARKEVLERLLEEFSNRAFARNQWNIALWRRTSTRRNRARTGKPARIHPAR